MSDARKVPLAVYKSQLYHKNLSQAFFSGTVDGSLALAICVRLWQYHDCISHLHSSESIVMNSVTHVLCQHIQDPFVLTKNGNTRHLGLLGP